MPTEKDIPTMKLSFPNSNTPPGIVYLCCMMPYKWVFLWSASMKSPKLICGSYANTKNYTTLNSKFQNTTLKRFQNHYSWKPNKRDLQTDKSHICCNVWKVRFIHCEMKWAWSAFTNSSIPVLQSFKRKRLTTIRLLKMKSKSKAVKNLSLTKVSILAEKKLLFWDQVPIESVRG